MLGKSGFRGTILYRIKVLPSHHPSPLQNQDLIDPKKNGLMEMILLQNQEPAFCIWHLSTKSKPIGVGKKGFQGNYSLQNQGPSLSPSLTSTESRSEGKTLMSMFLLQNQEPAFCIWHLSTKSKPIGVGKKGFQGNYSLQNQGPSLSPSLTSTESRSEGMTLMSMFLLQNQRPYDITSLIFSKISSLPKM